MAVHPARFSDRFVPVGEGASYLVRRIFLDEVDALDRYLALIRPLAAVLALRSGQDGARIGVDEQPRRRAFFEPLRIAVGDRDDIGGLAVERNFTRPGQGRTPRLAGLQIRLSIRVHFLVAELA